MRFKFVLVLAFISILMMSSNAFAHESPGGEADYHARVGELLTLEGKLDTTEQRPLEVRFRAVRLEDGAQILSMNSRSLDGSYKFAIILIKVDFPDPLAPINPIVSPLWI